MVTVIAVFNIGDSDCEYDRSVLVIVIMVMMIVMMIVILDDDGCEYKLVDSGTLWCDLC